MTRITFFYWYKKHNYLGKQNCNSEQCYKISIIIDTTGTEENKTKQEYCWLTNSSSENGPV